MDEINHACLILEAICLELDLAERDSDPYPLERAYLMWMLEDTCGLVWYDDDEACWIYSYPTYTEALRINNRRDKNSFERSE